MSTTDPTTPTPLYAKLRCDSCVGSTEHRADSRGDFYCGQCGRKHVPARASSGTVSNVVDKAASAQPSEPVPDLADVRASQLERAEARNRELERRQQAILMIASGDVDGAVKLLQEGSR